MPNGTTALSSLLILSVSSFVAQATLPDEKVLGIIFQFPAVAVVVWLLIQQNKDRNRKDGEQSAMLREMVTASVNGTKALDSCSDAIRGNTAIMTELKHNMTLLRESVAHQRSIIEHLRGEVDHKVALHHTTQRIQLEETPS